MSDPRFFRNYIDIINEQQPMGNNTMGTDPTVMNQQGMNSVPNNSTNNTQTSPQQQQADQARQKRQQKQMIQTQIDQLKTQQKQMQQAERDLRKKLSSL